MDENYFRELLNQVRDGQINIDQALEALQKLPFVDLGFAKVDSHRALRNGFPEVVYCEGKRLEHIIAILQRLTQGPGPVLATFAGGVQCGAGCHTGFTL
jgi:NCAIR mutase (PurE)-related protein